MSFNVLIVDDSAVMRAMIARVVRLSGVPLGEMFEAPNGAEGMLRRLRAEPETAALPVIVVSTESSDTRVHALESLGVAFVHKPFAPEDLRDTILRITGVTPDDEYYTVSAADGDDADF